VWQHGRSRERVRAVIVAPFVARLRVFPFKSLDGTDVGAATLTTRGGLEHDREFALVDDSGAIVNGKREPRVHELRVSYDPYLTQATFASPRLEAPFTFVFDDDPGPLASWFAQHFERPISVVRDRSGGFPDDPLAPGPTVVATETLGEVASWFAGFAPDDVRRRLRANIEIGSVPTFWDDGLYASAGEVVAFRIGAVVLEGTNPCARCVVPSRDPLTGVARPEFAKIVSERRAAGLPPWAERSRFNHYYRLAVNTRADPAQAGRTIAVGDPLERLVVSAL